MNSIRLHELDNCVVLGEDIKQGDQIADGDNIIIVSSDVALGHKVAIRSIPAGEAVFKYGVSIGSATSLVQPGDHIHLHNMKSDYLPTYILTQDEEANDE